MPQRIRIDATPLRVSRDFRILFIAGAITLVGSFASYVALPMQMARITHSYVAVGLMGVVELIPLVVFGLWGGVLADRVDRRRMVLSCEVSFIAVLAALIWNALQPEPRAFVLYLAGALFAVIDGLQRPSLEAMLPRLVPSEHLAAAGALQSLRSNAAFMVGPAVGGVLVAWAGAQAAYIFDAVTFACSALLIVRMRPIPPASRETSHVLHDLRDGIQYATSRRDILGTYAVDTIAMVFAYSTALFPFLATELHAEWALGALYSAPAIGSLIASSTSGWTSRVHHHGRMIVFAAMTWGLAILLIGVAPNIIVVLTLLAIAGAADMVSGLFRSLIWNLTIPDTLRGRLAGIEMLAYSIGPQLSGVRASFIARATSLRASFIIGGAITVSALSFVPQGFSSLWSFDDRTNEHAVREREHRNTAK